MAYKREPGLVLVPCVACGQHHRPTDKACPHCNAPVPELTPAERIHDAQEFSLAEAGITVAAIAALAIGALNATGTSVNGLIQKVYGSSLSTVSSLPKKFIRETLPAPLPAADPAAIPEEERPTEVSNATAPKA